MVVSELQEYGITKETRGPFGSGRQFNEKSINMVSSTFDFTGIPRVRLSGNRQYRLNCFHKS